MVLRVQNEMLAAAVVIATALDNLVYCVDYTKIVKWERRSLICFGNDIKRTDDHGSACKLTIGDNPALLETECFDEKFTEKSFANDKKNKTIPGSVRTICDVRCKGADRDSVISKIPNSAYECIRWHNYNTLQKGDEWYMWRSGKCRDITVTLEVHCGFPTSEPNSINILAQNNISLSTRIHL